MTADSPGHSRPESPAMILRAELRQAHLDAIGGEPLHGSGFETEIPEPGYKERE